MKRREFFEIVQSAFAECCRLRTSSKVAQFFGDWRVVVYYGIASAGMRFGTECLMFIRDVHCKSVHEHFSATDFSSDPAACLEMSDRIWKRLSLVCSPLVEDL